MPPRLFMTAHQASQEARSLVVLAEACLRRGEIAAAGDLVQAVRDLEQQFGTETLFGGAADLADAFDNCVQAVRELQS